VTAVRGEVHIVDGPKLHGLHLALLSLGLLLKEAHRRLSVWSIMEGAPSITHHRALLSPIAGDLVIVDLGSCFKNCSGSPPSALRRQASAALIYLHARAHQQHKQTNKTFLFHVEAWI
jgi:hypothetical protein